MAVRLLVLLHALAYSYAEAQGGTNIVNPTIAPSTATVLPSASGYSYVGCFNETIHSSAGDNTRALSGGKEIASNVMTIELCLSNCASGPGGAPIQFAGVEYGRECYCAQYLSRYSGRINETVNCNYACNGNGSQICGGADALVLYNMTFAAKTGDATAERQQFAWLGVVLIAVLVVCMS